MTNKTTRNGTITKVTHVAWQDTWITSDCRSQYPTFPGCLPTGPMLSLELMPTASERSLSYRLLRFGHSLSVASKDLYVKSLGLIVAMMRYSRTCKRSDLVDGGVRSLALLPTEGNLSFSQAVTTKSSCYEHFSPWALPCQRCCMSSHLCHVPLCQALRCQREEATRSWPCTLQRYKLSKHLFIVRYPVLGILF